MDDNPLIFRSSPRTLLSMAAFDLALLCWRHESTYLYPGEIRPLTREWFNSHEFTSGNILHAPSPIIEIIDRYIENFGKLLWNWLEDYLSKVVVSCDDYFLNNEAIFKIFDIIFIEPCDNIIGLNTAKKFVTADHFDPLDQFGLACEYSFETDIERLWPVVSDRIVISENSPPMLRYWYHRLRNELQILGGQENSPEFHIISLGGDARSWTNIEFLWDKLKTPEQTFNPVLTSFFRISNRSITPFVLSKLNRLQLEYVLTRMPCEIMVQLSKYDFTFEYALEIWNFMKDLITFDQFFEILYDLWEEAFTEKSRYADTLLPRLWLNSPQHLKHHVLNNYVEQFFDDLNNDLCKNCCLDTRFFLLLLIDTKFQLRNQLWSRNWRKFLMLARPDDFEKLLNLCENDVAEFKRKAMSNFGSLRNRIWELIKAGFSYEVIDYLKILSPDVSHLAQLKGQIIQWFLYDDLGSYMLFDNSRSVKKFLMSFIDGKDFIAVDTSLSKISTGQFIKLFIERQAFDKPFTPSFTELMHLIIGINHFLSSNQKYLAEVKRFWYEFCLRALNYDNVVIDYLREWDAFTKWCAPSLEEFRNALPVDRIFEKRLTEVILTVRCQCGKGINLTYLFLNNFLVWYFGTEDAVRKYKLSKIYNYNDVNAIMKMLREDNDMVISNLLNWFFDRDAEEIQRFRARVVNN